MIDKTILNKLNKAVAIELNPQSKYILLFPRSSITQDSIQQIIDWLADEGFMGVLVLVDGSPQDVEVIKR